MRLSGFHMPRWWQALWRRRYPMGATARLELRIGGEAYSVEPMPCGCGYRVFWAGGQLGGHSMTLGSALRRARKHTQSRAREAQV